VGGREREKEFLAKNAASAQPPSKSHVVSCLSARVWVTSLNGGQSLASLEKIGDGLSLSSMPLPGAMLARSAAAELGSGARSHRNGVHGRARAPSRQTIPNEERGRKGEREKFC
jgi:hypothetical protein